MCINRPVSLVQGASDAVCIYVDADVNGMDDGAMAAGLQSQLEWDLNCSSEAPDRII